MTARQFQRKIENFVCEHCGHEVKGTGYTNHCPQCLWSKHVDINPGDREHTCQGLMEPVGLEIKSGKQVIFHRCTKCGEIKRNKVADGDNSEEIIKISAMTA